MPEAFMKCVREGGRVFTKSLPKGRYVHGCSKGGKTYWGEMKMSNKSKNR